MRESFGDSYIEVDFKALDKLVGELGKNHYVDVGILGANAGKTEGKMSWQSKQSIKNAKNKKKKAKARQEAKAGMATVGMIGAIQEFGTLDGNIFPRSFIRMPLQTRQSEIQKAVEPRMQKHLEEGDVKGIFVDIGIAAEGVIQDAFDTHGFGSWVHNAQSTIAAKKGGDSPLIDTGLLRKSISSKAGGK